MQRITIPTPTIDAPLHGLVSSAVRMPSGDFEWENGVTFSPVGCDELHGSCITCPPEDKSEFQECFEPALFDPLLVEFGFSWHSRDVDYLSGHAEMQIDAGTSSVIERLIWDGCSEESDSPTLSEAPELGATLEPRAALAAVIQRLASSDGKIGARGTIHVGAGLAVMLSDYFYEQDGHLYTKIGGHVVIVGNYPPDMIAAHSGDIILFLGDSFITEAPAEIVARNEAAYRVERTALAAWNACTAFTQSVSVDLGS